MVCPYEVPSLERLSSDCTVETICLVWPSTGVRLLNRSTHAGLARCRPPARRTRRLGEETPNDQKHPRSGDSEEELDFGDGHVHPNDGSINK